MTSGTIQISDEQTICTALGGPIKYNSHNKASVYYAGKMLVITLKQRNYIWDHLNCKE